MKSLIDKELISQLLKLEAHQQEMVLAYIKNLLETDEMNRRVEESLKDIHESRTKDFDQFNEGFEQWKIRKKASTK